MIGDTWQKSSLSFSNSNCVEARWAKSSHSTFNGQCAEVRSDDGMIQVRDSKARGAGPVLSFTPAEWDAFIKGAKDGEFDLA